MSDISLLHRERVMADSGDYITVREAYNTFVRTNELAVLDKNLEEHRHDDRVLFEKIEHKLDDLRADKLPKWFLPGLVGAGAIFSPFLIVYLEHLWKVTH